MRRIVILFFALFSLVVSAQVEEDTMSVQTRDDRIGMLRIGYLSYDAVLHSMAQYDTLQVKMGELRQAYEKEMKRVEDEFNQKYELFLEERAQYPRTILLKRQQELQDMMQQNVNFKNESRRELQRTEQEAMAPLRIRLAEAIAAVAREEGLVLVVNTDADACPFIEPSVSTNIEPMVRQRLTTNP